MVSHHEIIPALLHSGVVLTAYVARATDAEQIRLLAVLLRQLA
jgi:hypothetical protein